MKIEIKDRTLIVRVKYLPTGIKYINLCGVILCRYTTQINAVDWTHEAIHSQQWYEMLIVGFLLWYCIEFLIRYIFSSFNWNTAYKNISLEREAYDNESNSNYISNREHLAWLNYL